MDKKLLDALAAKAEQRAKDRKNAKQFEVAGEMLTFVQPSVDAKLSYAEAMLSESAADTVRACASLIYDCCPDLQDPELHKALGVTDPYDTVCSVRAPRPAHRTLRGPTPYTTDRARPGARPCGILRTERHNAGSYPADVSCGPRSAAGRPGALV